MFNMWTEHDIPLLSTRYVKIIYILYWLSDPAAKAPVCSKCKRGEIKAKEPNATWGSTHAGAEISQEG